MPSGERREEEGFVHALDFSHDFEPGRNEDPAEVREFRKTLREIQGFGMKAGRALDLVQRLDHSSFLTRLMGLLKAG
jgi:hypothetical protein